ncbi:hypothetical protein JCM16358_08270 [Halanaerocella petrolearia]
MNKEKIDEIIKEKVDSLTELKTDGMIKELKEIAELLEESDYEKEYPELYEAKQKWIHDYISNIKGAKRERKKVIELLRNGVKVEKIAESVFLSKEEIKEIKEEINI